MRKLAIIAAALGAALALAAAALAGGGYGPGYGDGNGTSATNTTSSTSTQSTSATSKDETYKFTASLNGAQEVPKPQAPAGAGGVFTAKTLETKTAKWFTWKLTFHGLSGAAGAAHVHLGKKGVAGGVAISLCGPCHSGQTGKIKITSAAEDAMETGKAYVNVHTAKNPNGEIRGQIKLVK